MSAWRERLLLLLLAAAIPAGGFAFLIRPSLARIAASHARARAADAQGLPLRAFAPVDPDERALLEDPKAPWRARIPPIPDDGARLAHVDGVVVALAQALRARKVSPASLKAAWGAVKVDATVPAGLQSPVRLPAAGEREAGLQPKAWVLDLEVAGPTRDLFKALAGVAEAGPLLEPVGFTWGGERRQTLLLRNYVLAPAE